MSALPASLPPSPEPFARFGMGWRFSPPSHPVILTFDRITESRDDLSAEIHVAHQNGGHILRRRIRLMGTNTLRDLSRELDAIVDGRIDERTWRTLLIQGCESVIEAHRQGTPVITVEGPVGVPEPIHWQCDTLVMENVVNCWVAAAATGKSTMAKAYALHHALGIPFLGHDMKRGVPLYIDYEDTEPNFRRTLYQVARGLDLSTLPRMLWKRGGGPLKTQVYELAKLITNQGVTVIILDAVAAAGGEIGERGYESVALDIEQSLLSLPPVTVILLDHITGDELKTNAIPMKARGATRKYEFIRYQWTLTSDRERAQRGEHIVAWTHTKTNNTRWLEPFAVNLIHEDDRLAFGPAEAVTVRQIAERMTDIQRVVAELKLAQHPMTLRELVEAIKGEPTRAMTNSMLTTLKRHADVVHCREGYWDLVRPAEDNVTPIAGYRSADPDGDLPW